MIFLGALEMQLQFVIGKFSVEVYTQCNGLSVHLQYIVNGATTFLHLGYIYLNIP